MDPEKTYSFDIVSRGRVESVEYSHKTIGNKLQILRSYQENERELSEQKKKLEPYADILQSDAFREWIIERMMSGERVPDPPPAVAPGDGLEDGERELWRKFEEGVPGSAERLVLLRRSKREVL